jgi:hypothetical protein
MPPRTILASCRVHKYARGFRTGRSPTVSTGAMFMSVTEHSEAIRWARREPGNGSSTPMILPGSDGGCFEVTFSGSWVVMTPKGETGLTIVGVLEPISDRE